MASSSGRTRELKGVLFRSHLLITLIVLGVVTLIVFKGLVRFHHTQAREELSTRTTLFAADLEDLLVSERGDELQARCRELATMTESRVTVIAPDGEVWADSRGDAARMENHADRPEVIEARATGLGSARRYSDTLRRDMLYVARRVGDDGPVIRVALSLEAMAEARHQMQWQIGLSGLLLAGLAALLSHTTSRRVTRPLVEAMEGARRFADGDLGFRLSIPEQAEVGRLAESLNEMAGRLSSRIRQVQDSKEEENTILSSMSEGVIAVDQSERIIKVNQAASMLLRVPAEEIERRTMQEVFRHAGLLRFLSRVLGGEDEIEEELVSPGDGGGDRVLRAQGSILRNAGGDSIGAVVVIQDITRVRSLEDVRREFVANVSHELKTPVTSIRGFVETLRDGAINDPEEAGRFLEIIDRQTSRLNTIIDDLLTLSQLEETAGKGDLRVEEVPVRPVLDGVVHLCQAGARERNVNVEVACSDELAVSMNAPLIEQAVLNLVDNAIKYGREGGQVRIEAVETAMGVSIRVRDEGDGIAREHLDRVFERFYRVDKARSRDKGGSGLGLSIVKHIAQAHRGIAMAESEVGKGSEFAISLPKVG